MSSKPIHTCKCDVCQQAEPDAVKEVHHQMNVLMSRLDEQQRRWYAAVEAKQRGYGGTKQVSEITGLTEKTIKRGMDELETDLSSRPRDKTRLPGGGRPPIQKKCPT